MMQLEMVEDLNVFVAQNPEAKMLNFSENNFVNNTTFDTIVIGCEGGFHEEEVALFTPKTIVGFNTPLVLKSESAACAVASKVLL
jgi:16S rRNA (uracil1498-N3)-methyltransferase